VIASSDNTVGMEGDDYFPLAAVTDGVLIESDTTSVCPVDGTINEDAAWYYPDPKKPAKEIRGHVAVWKGVEVSR
jgi:uncharacterized protein (DUF427 family)